jgi:hypothetical protein
MMGSVPSYDPLAVAGLVEPVGAGLWRCRRFEVSFANQNRLRIASGAVVIE